MRGEATMNADIRFKKDGRLKIFVDVEPNAYNQNETAVSYKIVEKREGSDFKVSMRSNGSEWRTVLVDDNLEFIFGSLGI